MLKRIALIGNKGIRITTSVIAIVFLLSGFFTLWDMYRTEMKAFASYDLLKYRPDIENDEPPYLDELLDINPDTAAWVTIYGTNIDYPIFQGETDMEYLNKDAYGKFAITGSIFLSVLNKKDFSDPYNLIYGHHMDNGSMFGDIDKFNQKGFFFNKNKSRYKKEEGVLIMENQVYNLHVYALLKTDAYDHEVYRADKKQEDIEPFLQYVESKAKYRYKNMHPDKILAMSTCDNATTAARTVLLCSMTKRTTPLPTREEEQLTKHTAIGHPMAGAYWALLNLAALILCLYIIMPLHVWLKKVSAYINVRKKKKKETDSEPKEEEPKQKKKKTFSIKTVFLILTGIADIVFFVLTEDMHKPLQIVDRYTPYFILLALIAWILRKLILVKKNDQVKKYNENNGNDDHVSHNAVAGCFIRIGKFFAD